MIQPNEKTMFGHMLDDFQVEVAGYISPNVLSCEIVPRLILYRDAIGMNFVPWMSHVLVRCKSDVASAACQGNLSCEVRENHPAMLRRYVAQLKAREGDYLDVAGARLHRIAPFLNVITSIVQTSAIDGLIVMAALEHASIVFISQMRRWGEILDFTDFEYVDSHGAADRRHADELQKAIEAEVHSLELGTHSIQKDLLVGGFLNVMAEGSYHPSPHPTLYFVHELLRGIFA